MDEKVKRRKLKKALKKARKRVDELLDLTIADYHRSTAVGLITVLLNVVEDPDDSDRVQEVREQKRDFFIAFPPEENGIDRRKKFGRAEIDENDKL